MEAVQVKLALGWFRRAWSLQNQNTLLRCGMDRNSTAFAICRYHRRQYLGGHERATRWLKRPNRALGGLAPVAAIDTELGARQVENILGRIAYGGIS